VDAKTVNDMVIWGAAICLFVIGVGVYRSWKAGRRSLALVPVWILLAGRLIVPFAAGFIGLSPLSRWISLIDIAVATAFSLYLIFRFESRAPA